jgi:FAD/FMN-containing dehydrogenase
MAISIGEDGFYHPSNVSDVVDLINMARNDGKVLRVRGSGHSVPHAIYPDGFPYREAEYYAPSFVANTYRLNFQPVRVPKNIVPVLLDRMASVTFLDADQRPLTSDTTTPSFVRAQAGVHLGQDPYDPTAKASYFVSLFYQMEQRGVAVPDMGGITHQTVGGFLATGSSGGTLTYSLEKAIVEFTFVDGHGRIHVARRGDDTVLLEETVNGRSYRWSGNDLFQAVGVSMGLLGVVTEVVFACEPRYDIIGEEHIRPITDYADWIDFFGEGEKGLAQYLRKTEYSRLLWWPQKGTKKMTVWQARRMVSSDYNPPRVTVVDNRTMFVPQPYQEVNWLFGSPLLLENLGDLFYTAVAQWPSYLRSFITFSWLRYFVQSTVESLWYGFILPKLLSVFVTTDKKDASGGWKPQQFWDTWWRGLPMDNQMDDRLMGVVFTEIWIPLEHTAKVMRTLRDHYDKNGLSATGTFTAELYATKASEFWMSPAHGTDVFRVDVFLSATDTFDPREYYDQFWEILQPYSFRTHWGKWIPGATDTAEKNAYWRNYLKGNFTKWEEFLDLRHVMDPQQAFVNHYWRERFDIPALAPTNNVEEPLTWMAPTPPHLKQPVTPETVASKPNQALLLGRPAVPPAPFMVYLASLVYAGIYTYVIEELLCNILQWSVFSSRTIELAVIVLVSLLGGLGTTYLRKWGPIAMYVVMGVAIAAANIFNAMLGSTLWTWHPALGMDTLWTAIVGEGAVVVWIVTLSWLTGKVLFKKYWPS